MEIEQIERVMNIDTINFSLVGEEMDLLKRKLMSCQEAFKLQHFIMNNFKDR